MTHNRLVISLINLGLQELESTLAKQKKEHEAAVTALKSSLAEQTAEIAKALDLYQRSLS